jgi:hypothetical protein
MYYRITAYFIILGITWFFFPPVYFKSDDAIMSMISGGYGQMHDDSFLLYHSSVIIGFISSKLPYILGIAPYNYINLGLLVFNFISLNELLNKINKKFYSNLFIAYASSLFILIRPTFTTIAGYLCVVGTLSIYFYNSNKDRKYLIFGLTLFLSASFIRDEMAIFFLAFAGIILVQSFVKNKNNFILIGTVFLIIFSLSQFINRQQYSVESLKDLRKFEEVRYPIVDYNADKHILQNSEVILRNDYSSNDINLIRNWFFVDSYLSSPSRLDRLLIETLWRGPLSNFNSKESILSSINLLRNYPLNFIFISTIIMTFLANRNRTLKILWLFFILVLFVGAIVGRQLAYVYFPLLIFLFLFSYLQTNKIRPVMRYFIYSLSVSIIFTTFFENKLNKATIEKVNLTYESIKQDKLWVIGGGLPSEFIFPLLRSPNVKTELITSDWSIYAPKSNFVKYNSNNNFLSELQSQQGVNIATNNYHLPLIQIYCKEKFGSDLIINPVVDGNLVRINNLKCPSSQLNIISPNMEYLSSGKGFLWITPAESKFYLLNYANKDFKGTHKLLSQNNPCNENISYTLTSPTFRVSSTSSQEFITFPVSLKPYEKLLITVSTPNDQKICKIEGDNRSFVVMFKNSD